MLMNNINSTLVHSNGQEGFLVVTIETDLMREPTPADVGQMCPIRTVNVNMTWHYAAIRIKPLPDVPTIALSATLSVDVRGLTDQRGAGVCHVILVELSNVC